MVGAEGSPAFSGWFKLVDGAGSSMVQVLLSLQWLVLVYQPSVVGAQAAEPSSSVSGAVAQDVEPSVVVAQAASVAGAGYSTFSG